MTMMVLPTCLSIFLSCSTIVSALTLPRDFTNQTTTTEEVTTFSGGPFETKVQEGMSYLRAYGATGKRPLKIILGHPASQKAKTASDFTLIQIKMVNTKRKLDLQTQNYPFTDDRWVQPIMTVDQADDCWGDWNLEEGDLKLEEAVEIVNKAGYEGPWEILSVFSPRESWLRPDLAAEPMYGFHTERGVGFAVVGLKSRKCWFYGKHLWPWLMPYDDMDYIDNIFDLGAVNVSLVEQK